MDSVLNRNSDAYPWLNGTVWQSLCESDLNVHCHDRVRARI